MDILRFITAGNVDDGKSTLTGRLLYDTGNIKSDILKSVSENDEINLAYITDGLRSEREQRITIDVAYKYFVTPQRKYIITDAPGHFQYTRNLVTGASATDAIIILIDASHGITGQTRRHTLVASFLHIKHIVVAVNKMDIVGNDEAIFNTIKRDYSAIAKKINLCDITYIPISALGGDNVTTPSLNMPWYSGNTLLQYLANCSVVEEQTSRARFTIQCAINNGYAGKMLSGTFNIGDEVTIYPQHLTVVISKITNGYKEASQAKAGENICLYFTDDIELQRGSLIAHYPPQITPHMEADICWLDSTEPLRTGKKYLLRIHTAETVCTVTSILYKTDNDTFQKYHEETVSVNQFARILIELKDTIAYDPYNVLPETGRGIIIDPVTNYTSGAFTVCNEPIQNQPVVA